MIAEEIIIAAALDMVSAMLDEIKLAAAMARQEIRWSSGVLKGRAAVVRCKREQEERGHYCYVQRNLKHTVLRVSGVGHLQVQLATQRQREKI